MASQRIGLLGGTFDPIHLGHLLLAVHSYEKLSLERVMFIPARLPPHKAKPVAQAAERLEMIRLAVSGDSRFLVCECELSRPEPSYTIDTVRQLQSSLGAQTKLFWLIGSDILADLPSWHEMAQLVELVDIVVVSRAGQGPANFSILQTVLNRSQIKRITDQAIEVPLIEIASTEIRRRIALGQSIRYFVPETVNKYISDRGLYR